MSSRGLFSHKKKAAPYASATSQEQAAIEKAKRINLIAIVVIFVGVILYTLFTDSGAIEAAFNEEALGVVPLNHETIIILLEDIESVELCEGLSEFDRGAMHSGEESDRVYSGTYANDAFGEYQLHTNIKVDPYIVVRHSDGTLIFNRTTAQATTDFYTDLRNALGG